MCKIYFGLISLFPFVLGGYDLLPHLNKTSRDIKLIIFHIPVQNKLHQDKQQ